LPTTKKKKNANQDPSDPVSYACAWLALVPQALCVVYATLIWSSREAEVALMFAGQLACEAVNFALKRLIKEERPRRIHGKGYGMPSSHAQFVAFWAVALTLFLLVRHQPRRPGRRANTAPAPAQGLRQAAIDRVNGAAKELRDTFHNPHRPWSFLERALVSVVALGLAAAVAWSRIYLAYHTPKQVLVGSLAGTVCGVVWFAVTALLRELGWLAWFIELPLVRWFRVRDLVVEEDLPQSGWEKWEERQLAAKSAKKK